MDEKNNLPRVESPHTTLPEDTLCQSCGRFVGAYSRCPYCQAEMATRFSIVLAKRIAVFGSIIGLVILLIASRAKKVETIEIGTIAENNNMALVRVVGRVVNLRLREDQNGFSLSLDDGTGRISLSAFDKLRIFRDRMGENFPRIGDMVSAVGNLQITEKWGATMFLSSPGRLKLVERIKIEARSFDDISHDDINKIFDIQAEVASIKKFSIGRTIALRQGETTLPLSIFDKDYEKIGSPDLATALLTPGSVIALRASASEYRGDLQLRIENPADRDNNKVVSRGAGKPVTGSSEKGSRKPESSQIPKSGNAFSEVTMDRVGGRVTIDGSIASVKDFKTGLKLELSNNGAKMTVWVKSDIRDSITDKTLLQKGARVKVSGTISSFKNALQVNPETTDDLTAWRD
ncbi:MAG: hypothetical protein CVV64_10650 [Candidatus Wallbacteria bacterium HGW-Wallbacteria-1]|uniref:OB domain-containing protein n=1 Tax=Candidatus Wallbacteria bacterium HGW-Wallbacteria-1 TaxID=2013854 RepID=A0A2N1PPC1_9BACT|nr:MAG: hypothetical protein CVV64_10650 [Candidatus Wallbacteria bacterium HGW-Wallbacteria-1]